MLLSVEQIHLLLDRLKWEPLYEDDRLVLARKRGGGYSDDPKISQIEAALSIMGEVASKAAKRTALSLLALVLLTGCGAKVTTVHWQMTAAPPDLRLAATEGELMNLAGVPLGVINCTAASVSPKADVTMGVAGCFKPNGELAFGGVTPGVSSWDAWLRGLGIAADFAQAGLTYGASVVIADGMKAAAKAIPREVTATTTGSVSTTGTVNVGAIPSVNVNPVTGSFDLVPVAP